MILSPLPDNHRTKTKIFTMNLAQAAATYDLAACNAVGGVLVETVQIFGNVVGATFTSVSIQTDNTVPEEIMSAVEGAVVNIVAGKNIKSFVTKFYLAVSKKIQFTIVGSTGTGSCLVVVTYKPTVNGADIS